MTFPAHPQNCSSSFFAASRLRVQNHETSRMRTELLLASLVVAGAACSGGDARAGSTEIVLDSAEASLGELDHVSGLAELPDGRVVITQGAVPSVLFADFSSGEIDTIGRSGEGPGEYRFPGIVFMKGGRVSMFDFGPRRLTTWNADGSLDSALSIATMPGFTIAFDTIGYMYAEQPTSEGFVVMGQELDSTRSKDSTYVYRFRPNASERDTIARLYEIGNEIIRIGNGIARMRRLYQSADVWGVTPDGTLWIVRGRENRVDRRAPDGTWTIGAPRPFTPIPTTEADRQKLPPFRGIAGDSVDRELPKEKGPYQDAVGAPDGEVWTRLNQPTGHTREIYAIHPVSGAPERTVSFPKGYRVRAITDRYVYVTHEDENGFQVLERFGRPSGQE